EMAAVKNMNALDQLNDYARGMLDDSLADVPTDSMSRCRLAVIDFETGQAEKAEKGLHQASQDPRSKELAATLSSLYGKDTPQDDQVRPVLNSKLRLWYRDATLRHLDQRTDRKSEAFDLHAAMQKHGD